MSFTKKFAASVLYQIPLSAAAIYVTGSEFTPLDYIIRVIGSAVVATMLWDSLERLLRGLGDNNDGQVQQQ